MTQTKSQVNVKTATRINATLQYRYDDGAEWAGESGREWVTLTVDSNETRTVRTLSELDDVDLRRDTTITYDPGFQAREAYIHMVQRGAFLGSGWYRFEKDSISLEAETATEGRVSQRMDFDEPIGIFAPHPVFLDGWHSTQHDPNGPAVQDLRNCITSSPLWDGASGPLICAQHRRLERLADEDVTVTAGTFACESYQLIPHAPGRPPIKFWVHGPHKLFVKLRWDFLKATYELVDLQTRT